MTTTYDLLMSYIGKEFTDEIINEINSQFAPYIINCCDDVSFYDKQYWTNQIRCVVENGIIIKLSLN
jgi:hypothetical protein